jgi:alpha-ribazole phosphatase
VAKEIIFIRHSSLAVPRGVCYGFTDIDVSSNFSMEADWLKRTLSAFNPGVVVSSPLQRCMKLAVEVFNAPIIVDDNLKEVNYGDWEGEKWEDIGVEGDNLWMYQNINNRPPNGESFNELQARVIEVFDDISKNNQDKIVVVCHGGVIRSVLSHILSTPLAKTRSYDIHYVGFVKFEKSNEDWRLVELNSGYR